MGDEEYSVTYLDGDQETTNYISRAGKVEIKYPNSDVYIGKVNADGLKHDTDGEYSFRSCQVEEDGPFPVYKGNYEKGNRSGLGTMKCLDGSEYRGMWKNNKYNGKGSVTYSNGDIYSGEWKDGKRSGAGTYLFQASEARLKGEWKDGSIHTGEFQHADGTKYTGSFQEGAFYGPATYAFKKSGLNLKGQIILQRTGTSTTEPRWVTEQLT